MSISWQIQPRYKSTHRTTGATPYVRVLEAAFVLKNGARLAALFHAVRLTPIDFYRPLKLWQLLSVSALETTHTGSASPLAMRRKISPKIRRVAGLQRA